MAPTRSAPRATELLRSLAQIFARARAAGRARRGQSETATTRTRIIVQFGVGRLDVVHAALERAHVQGGLAFGEIEADRIEELESLGMAVERLDDTRGQTPLAHPAATLPEGRYEERRSPRPPPLPEGDIFVLGFGAPLFAEWREQLDELEVRLIEHLGDLRFTARVQLDRLSAVAALGFVESLRPYAPQETASAWELLGASVGETRLELLAHELEGVESIVAWLEQHELPVKVVLVAGRKVRLINPEPTLVPALAAHPEVASLYQFVDPVLFNDRARALVGITDIDVPSAATFPWAGDRQVVGIADSGLDVSHPDLDGRILDAIARARSNDFSDITGHGTHVTGSIVGTGAASSGTIRGIAPGARVLFQSIMDRGGELDVPSMVEVLEEAYEHGARVHCDSWGVPRASGYDAYATEVDEFVARHPDMLVVTAAGNTGTAAGPLNAQPGWVDLMSVASPGTAKNALTVGASRSDRPPVASPETWGEWDRYLFPLPPVADELRSGDPERLAASSGRGPCDDESRIKPDVVAPGTFILSARATGASGPYWADHPSPEYGYWGGTSMAAAIVAGCGLRVRQYLVEARDHEPSAALLKAVLVNGAHWLNGPDAVADHADAPNYHQGFGRVSLSGSVPSAASGLALEFVDPWNDASLDIDADGRGVRLMLEVSGGPLRVCLAWTDPPRNRVQNALGFKLEHDKTRSAWFGNEHRPGLRRPRYDRNNNVQVVRIEQAEAGQYSLFVEAGILTKGPQRFALAVTGAAGLRLEPVSTY